MVSTQSQMAAKAYTPTMIASANRIAMKGRF